MAYKPNFNMGNVYTGPSMTDTWNKGAGSLLNREVDRMIAEEDKAKAAKERESEKLYRSGRDTILDKRAADIAATQAQQYEWDSQIKAAEAGNTSDYRLAQVKAAAEESKRNADHRASMTDLSNKQFELLNKKYTDEMAAAVGAAFGEGQVLPDQKETGATTTTRADLTEAEQAALLAERDKRVAAFKPMTQEQADQAWVDYKNSIDPNYSTMKVGDKPGILGDVKNFFSQGTYSKDALAKYHKTQNMTQAEIDAMPPTVGAEKPMDKKTFMSHITTGKALSEENSKLVTALLSTAKEQDKLGIGKNIVTAIKEDVPEPILRQNVDKVLQEYKTNNPNDQAGLVGLANAMNKRLGAILSNRAAVSTRALDRSDVAFKASLDHASKKELLTMKNGLTDETDALLDSALKQKRMELIDARIEKLKEDD